MSSESKETEGNFFPKGALAFFGALLAFYGAVWLGLFALLVGRR